MVSDLTMEPLVSDERLRDLIIAYKPSDYIIDSHKIKVDVVRLVVEFAKTKNEYGLHYDTIRQICERSDDLRISLVICPSLTRHCDNIEKIRNFYRKYGFRFMLTKKDWIWCGSGDMYRAWR